MAGGKGRETMDGTRDSPLGGLRVTPRRIGVCAPYGASSSLRDGSGLPKLTFRHAGISVDSTGNGGNMKLRVACFDLKIPPRNGGKVGY